MGSIVLTAKLLQIDRRKASLSMAVQAGYAVCITKSKILFNWLVVSWVMVPPRELLRQ